MKKYRFLIFLPLFSLVLLLSSGCSTSPSPQSRQTVEVEWPRYLGTWYSIGRYPHRFERDLQRVRAHYELRDDGRIAVVNSGYNADGEYREARAVARILDEPGVLKVYFVPVFGGEYRVLYLDADYHYALVGSRTADYLWLLSRTPEPDERMVERLLEEALERGYDLSRFERVEQQPIEAY